MNPLDAPWFEVVCSAILIVAFFLALAIVGKKAPPRGEP
jgi:hypothetical protein